MRHRARPLLRFLVLAIAVGFGFGAATAQQTGVVEIRMLGSLFDARFDPVGVHVAPGTTIRFVNAEYQHSSRAYAALPGYDVPQRIPDGADAWITPLGTDTEIVLTVEGVYDFFDPAYVEMGMVGRIVVGDPAAFPARDPSELPEDAQEVLPSVEAILAQPDGVLTWDAWEAMRE